MSVAIIDLAGRSAAAATNHQRYHASAATRRAQAVLHMTNSDQT